jgi:type I restriction enzyme M protein
VSVGGTNIGTSCTGDEIGKLSYGTGRIPFIRTSDISNWELKIDPKKGVSEKIYKILKKKQDVKEQDILLVRDYTTTGINRKLFASS